MSSEKLRTLRRQIDVIDADIMEQLAARQALSREIGQVKAQLGLQIVDEQREKYLLNYHEMLYTRYKLSPALIKPLFALIIADSQELQKRETQR